MENDKRIRRGLTGKPIIVPFEDAKDHLSSDSDMKEMVKDLCREITALREALLRTQAVNTGLKDECRKAREAIIAYADKSGIKELLKGIPAIPEDDPFVEAVVARASIIDSGRTCKDSCESHICAGSSCPLYAVMDEKEQASLGI